MGENNDLYFEKVLLKNIDEDIPINVDLSNSPRKALYPQLEHRKVS